MQFSFPFILLHISLLLAVLLFVSILKMKKRTQLHYAFLAMIFLLIIWTLGHILEVYSLIKNGVVTMFFVYLYYFGLTFLPVTILLIGIIYMYTKIKVSYKLLLLFIPPIIDYICLLTNNSHHLYFTNYSIYNNLFEVQILFHIHASISYIYILIGVLFLIIATIENSGFFSYQAGIIIIGVIAPLIVNILITLKIIICPTYVTAITFSFAILCFAVSIFRFQLLKIAPIALKTIVDRISDGFLVLDEDYQVIDFNQTIEKTFENVVTVSRNKSMLQMLEGTSLYREYDKLIGLIQAAKETQTNIDIEKHIKEDGFDKHFKIEVTPIISNNNYLGTILLFKDITENIKHIEAIEEKHAVMMEQERLASLGQLIGGIAHNLNTPIMSIAGAVEGLRDLVDEYEESIGDENVTIEDHCEIAEEMRVWLDKIKPYTAYMSDVISAVKGQARHFNQTMLLTFTVGELVKRIELLMKYELIRYNCELKTFINVNKNTEIYGDVNSLVQIFDNIIINAIQAYEGRKGTIEFTIEKKEDGILFAIKDYAKGIPESIKDRLLKEMVTTKGKDGTGLGLYMSYSTIRGRFGGKMWFESEEGKGTTFFIQLPYEN